MKKLIAFSIAISCICTTVFGVAFSRISATSVTFFNFSGSNYDVSGHKLSIDNTFYDIDNLTIESGDLNVLAALSVSFNGLTIPTNAGSLGLWYPSTNTAAPMASDMVAYVQWGALGQAFETEAIAGSAWWSNSFIDLMMPFKRTSFMNNDASEWREENPTTGVPVFNNVNIAVGPNPFNDNLTINCGVPGNNHFQLYSLGGKLLLDERILNAGSVEIETGQLIAGAYILRVTNINGETLAIKKLVK